MPYTIENINDCTRKILFQFDSIDLSKEIEKALEKQQREANLKGFRKGKAPIPVIKRLFGPQIEQEALGSFIQNEFYRVIQEEKLQAIGYPAFNNTKYESGKSVSFDVVVEVFPEVKIKDFGKLSFKQEKLDVEEDEVNKVKDSYLGSKAVMEEVTEPGAKLKVGQFCVINFEGALPSGERPQNMKAEEYLLEIGSNTFIPGFEEQLVGMKKGEQKEISVIFPADYHEPSLQSAPVKFYVDLLELKEQKRPTLTEELSQELGFESVSDLDKKIREDLGRQKERQSREKLHMDILNKLIDENPFDVPMTLQLKQKEYVRNDLQGNLKQQGLSPKMIEEYFVKWDDDITQKAIFQVKTGLILDKLSKDLKVEVGEEEYRKKIDELQITSGLKSEEIESFYTKNAEAKRNFMYSLREEKTFDLIKEKVKVL